MAKNTTPITEQDIETVDKFLHDLKEWAQEAHTQKNLVMLRIYTDLLKVVSPRVTRLHARMERENMAVLNKSRKELSSGSRNNASA